MYKEILFRAFDKRLGRLLDVDSIDFENNFIMLADGEARTSSSFNNCVLEQFTGLHDKNGNKVFVGDYGWYDEIKWTVVWVEEKGSFGFRLEDFDVLDEINLFWEFSSLNEWFEVIGNIHEGVRK